MHPIKHPSYNELKTGSTACSNRLLEVNEFQGLNCSSSHMSLGQAEDEAREQLLSGVLSSAGRICDLSCSFLLSLWLQHCSKTSHLLQALQPCSCCCAWLPGLRHHRQGDDGETGKLLTGIEKRQAKYSQLKYVCVCRVFVRNPFTHIFCILGALGSSLLSC